MAITIPVYRLALSCTYQHCPIVFVRIRQFCYLVCCKVNLCYCRTLRVRTQVCTCVRLKRLKVDPVVRAKNGFSLENVGKHAWPP